MELPQRLQQCIELKSFTQAVEHYEKSAPILKKYHSLASFKSIEEQCAVLMKRLHTDLRAQMSSRDATSVQIGDAVRLLLRLGDDRAQLATKFIAWHDTHVNAMLKPLERDGVTRAQVRDAAGKVLPAIVDMHDKHEAAFGAATSEESDAATVWCRNMLTRYLSVARRALLSLGEAGAVLESLRVINAELMRVHAQLPQLGLSERVVDFESQTINELVGPILDGALQRCGALLHGDEAAPAAPAAASGGDDAVGAAHTMRAAGNAIGEAATAAIEHALADLTPLFAQSADDWGALLRRLRPVLSTKVQVKLQQLVLSLNLLLMDYLDPPRIGAVPHNYANAQHVLRLVHAARFLQLRTSPRCHDALVKLVDAGNTKPGAGGGDKRLDVPTLQAQFARSARSLLHRYASLVAQDVTAVLIARSPAPSAVGDLLVEQWRAALVDIDASGFSNSPSESSASGGGDKVTSTSSSAPLAAMQRGGLFQRRVDVFAEPHFSKPALVTTIVLRSLKSLVELVRRRAIATPVPLDAVDKFIMQLAPESIDDVKTLIKMVKL